MSNYQKYIEQRSQLTSFLPQASWLESFTIKYLSCDPPLMSCHRLSSGLYCTLYSLMYVHFTIVFFMMILSKPKQKVLLRVHNYNDIVPFDISNYLVYLACLLLNHMTHMFLS